MSRRPWRAEVWQDGRWRCISTHGRHLSAKYAAQEFDASAARVTHRATLALGEVFETYGEVVDGVGPA